MTLTDLRHGQHDHTELRVNVEHEHTGGAGDGAGDVGAHTALDLPPQ